MRIILDNIDRNKTYKKETVYQYFKRLVDISVSIALIIILFPIFLLYTISKNISFKRNYKIKRE